MGTASLTIALLFPLILLFPNGRLPSRRWRPVLWAIFVAFAGWASQLLQAGTTVTGGLTNALDAAHADYPNPFPVFPRHGWYSDLLLVIFVLGIVTGMLVVASVFVRRRATLAAAALFTPLRSRVQHLVDRRSTRRPEFLQVLPVRGATMLAMPGCSWVSGAELMAT
jgi:hypothetical protein